MFARRPSGTIPAINPDQAVIDNTEWEEIGAAPAQTMQQMQTATPEADNEEPAAVITASNQSSVPNAVRTSNRGVTAAQVGAKNTVKSSSADALLAHKDFQDVVAMGRATLSTPEGIKRAAMLAQSDLGVKSTAETYLSKLLVGANQNPELTAKANTLKQLEEAAQGTFLLPKAYNQTHMRVLNEITKIRTELDGATRGVAVQASKTQYAQNRLLEDKAVEDRAVMQDAEDYRNYKDTELMTAINTGKLNGMPVNYPALTMVFKEKLDANNMVKQLTEKTSLTPEQNNQRVTLSASVMTDAELENVTNHVRNNGANSRSIIDYKNIIGMGTDTPEVIQQEQFAFNHNRMSAFVTNRFGNLQLSEAVLNEERIKRSKSRAEAGQGTPAERHFQMQNLDQHTKASTFQASGVFDRVVNSGRSIDHQQLTQNAFEEAQIKSELDRTVDGKERGNLFTRLTALNKKNDDLILSTVAISKDDTVNQELLNYYKNGSLSQVGATTVAAAELDMNGSFTTAIRGTLITTDGNGRTVSQTEYRHAHPAAGLETMLRSKFENKIIASDFMSQMKRAPVVGGTPEQKAKANAGYLQETTMDQWRSQLKTLSRADLIAGKMQLTSQVGDSVFIENLINAAGTDTAGVDLIKSLTTTVNGNIALKPELKVKGNTSLAAIRATLEGAGRKDVWEKLNTNIQDDALQGNILGKFAAKTAGQQALITMFAGIGLNITERKDGGREATAMGTNNQFGKMIIQNVREKMRQAGVDGSEYKTAAAQQLENRIEAEQNAPGYGGTRLQAMQNAQFHAGRDAELKARRATQIQKLNGN